MPSVVPIFKTIAASRRAVYARKMRLADRSADAIAVFTSSRPVQ
jgi:hypothetical protein